MSVYRSSSKEQEILDYISKGVSQWFELHHINIENYQANKEFLFNDQYTSSERKEFKRLNKPCLTFNKTFAYYVKLIAEGRENPPDFEVRAKSREIEQDKVDIYEGILRNISYESNAEIAYQTCLENQAGGGFGALRITTDYEDSKSFFQRPFIEEVKHPDRVGFDPAATDKTFCDGDYCFYYDQLSKAEFKSKYPDIPEPKSYPMNAKVYNFQWVTTDTITVMEFYKKEYYSYTIYQLPNDEKGEPKVVTEKEYNELKKKAKEALGVEKLEDAPPDLVEMLVPHYLNKRTATDYKIKYYKAIADKIIEKNDWMGKDFPLVFVPGHMEYVDGLMRTISYTHFTKDSQRLMNYVGSEIAQAIKYNRREQYIGTRANVEGEGISQMWVDPSQQQGILLAEPDPITGQLPMKQPVSEISQSLFHQFQQTNTDIQGILGSYGANTGEEGQELSGKALLRRQTQGNLASTIFFSNLDRGIAQVGKVILSLIPKLYDTPRMVSITNPNKETKVVSINQPMAGNQFDNHLNDPDLEVTLRAGANFAVQREQSLEILMKLSAMPGVFPLIADLVAENVNLENTNQLIERLKNIVPPAIIAKEEGKPPPPPQPNPEAMAAQQEQALKQSELKLKEQQLQIDQQESQRKAQLDQIKAQLEIAKLHLDKQIAIAKSTAEIKKAELEYQVAVQNAMKEKIKYHTGIQDRKYDTITDMVNMVGKHLSGTDESSGANMQPNV